jgi:nucleoside-diphosphate-sugar epimerase
MPSVNPPTKVLVSGASGYIAMWVVRTLLEQGYAVRGTVRSHEKGEHLKKAFKSYGDRFELAIVPDIGEACILSSVGARARPNPARFGHRRAPSTKP